MNTKNIIVLAVFIATSLTTLAQNTEGVSIAPNVTPPHPSAMLDVQSSDKGVLIPRMTEAEKNAIPSPEESLLIYQTDGDEGYYYWDGTVWKLISGGYWEKVDLVTPFNYTRLRYEDNVANRGELRFGFADPDVAGGAGSWFTQKGGLAANGITSVTYAQLFHDNTLAFYIRSFPNPSVPANLYTTITATGSLYVGTSTAGKDVIFNPGYNVSAWVKDNGDFYAATSYQISDVNLKEDVTTLDSSLSKITELRGVSFKWIDTNKPQTTQIGVIAQEVEVYFPELVVETEVPTNDGSPSEQTIKTVNYSGLIAPMIEAIKEQQTTIQQLLNTISDLEDRIEALEAQ
ncbi:MAG: tail fiber domain-containing protein [Vicingaceae bacterium]|nr:tail fiber domain-containing protein [Vicingaceae bacterium]|tara:strand:+ start:17042 stop:18076 length:1035 start_codon:yes stop_codon:yes gene_type:complete